MLVIKRIPAVRGFTPITYAVYNGEKIVKIFISRKEAENFIKSQEGKRCFMTIL